jgi:hypothetical protein
VSSSTGSGRLGGYALLDLTTGRKPGRSVELFAKVANVFKRRYASAGQLGRNGFDAGGAVLPPEAWRNEQFVAPDAPRTRGVTPPAKQMDARRCVHMAHAYWKARWTAASGRLSPLMARASPPTYRRRLASVTPGVRAGATTLTR